MGTTERLARDGVAASPEQRRELFIGQPHPWFEFTLAECGDT